MELRENMLEILNKIFLGNKQKFIVSIKNSKEYANIRSSILEYTSFLVNPSFSQRLYHIFNGNTIPTCYCGNAVKFFDISKGYNKYCSPKCKYSSIELKNKVKQTNLERYGAKAPGMNQDIKNKVKQTNLERYGYESHNSAEKVKEKKKQVCLKKYGVENVSNTEFVKEKRKKTFLERFGVDNPNMSEEIKKKKKEYFLEKYGVDWITQNINIRERQKETLRINTFNRLLTNKKIQERVKFLFTIEEYYDVKKEYPFLCLQCQTEFSSSLDHGQIPRCLNCFPLSKGYSIVEKEIVYWLKKELKTENILENKRSVIPPYSIDIYIPEKNLAIEFNGLFWHGEISNKKDKTYHLQKTEKCLEKDIQLIHIFEDEWINKQEIVKSIIKHKLGVVDNKIYARETNFKEIDSSVANIFLEENHLQSSNSRCTYFFGLFHNNDLIFVTGLGRPRYNQNYDYEIIRSCSKINTLVLGGFEKIIKNLPLHGNFISYVDRRYFNGSGYKNWIFFGKTNLNYFYMKDYKYRENRMKYKKNKLPKLFPNVYDKDLTEWEIMQLAGYDRIWDCGNLAFSRQL